MIPDTSRCDHCGACRAVCPFLDKYRLDLGRLGELSKLAYHCFLCGRCNEVCPQGLSGKELMLSLRRRQVQQAGGRLQEGGYEGLIKEKLHYQYRNYSGISAETKRVVFAGCSFPSYYPETCRKLGERMRRHGVPIVYDCCGKPVEELGMKEEADRIGREIDSMLRQAGVEEVIMVCPNCMDHLRPYLTPRVRTVYEILEQWGEELPGKEFRRREFFLPCPDRERREWLAQIQRLTGGGAMPIEGEGCCGLGGCAAGKEPEISAGAGERLVRKGYQEFYTYCASCSGKFARGKIRTTYILSELLGVEETADTEHGIQNRRGFGEVHL